MKIAASLLALLPAASLACNHANMKRQAGNETDSPFKFDVGTDGPANPATLGFYINHIGLLVSNITASRDWYSEVIGLRHIFTFDMADKFIICYMGHAQGGRNGTGFQSGEELLRDKNNIGGLIEFMQYKPDSDGKKFEGTPANTFSHIGLIVPDIQAAQDRFDELGNVHIIKRIGDIGFERGSKNHELAKPWGVNDIESEENQNVMEEIAPGIEMIGFKQLLVIADPDGNLIEIQQQDAPDVL